ncbi:hypothetical protein [Sphingomicrobium nitratireducens]|uniref:hypothetical protein n=1 Tax=Sphingomicrobium nitratireducens TaxID=2964666 RepID=UPI00223F5CC7|nr:hypothetical protein [Sphingomicrobium nitratireducens]
MRKFIVPTAAAIALSGMLAATPAAARDWNHQGDRYERGYERGYDRQDYRGGRHFAYGKIREMQDRVAQMRRDIRHFDRIDAISKREARQLDRQAERLQHRIGRMGYNGLSRGEYRNARQGIRTLRAAIQRELHDGRRWGNYGYGYQGYDRYDRDDDRWERDGRWDREEYRGGRY